MLTHWRSYYPSGLIDGLIMYLAIVHQASLPIEFQRI